MKKIYLFVILVLGICTYSISHTQAQQYSEFDLKVALMYQFCENVSWPNEDKLAKFTIGVAGDAPEMLSNFKKLAASKKIKGLPIEVTTVSSTKNLGGVQALYLNKDKSKNVDDYTDAARSAHVLLVSDQSEDQEFIMINFQEQVNNTVQFEINKTSIIFAGITPQPRLLLIGGKEVDVRDLYKKSEEASRKLKNQIKEQTDALKKQEAEINQKKAEVEKHKEELASQDIKLKEQTEALSKQEAELNSISSKLQTLAASIDGKEKILEEKNEQISRQETEMAEKEKLLQENTKAVEEQVHKLSALNKEIEEKESHIRTQNIKMVKQDATILYQEYALYLFAGFTFIIFILLFWIFRNYRIMKRINTELERKNVEIQQQHREIQDQNNKIEIQKQEIVAQNEELHQQQDEIMSINESLEIQQQELLLKNKFITDGIRYAKTIQHAILPSKEQRLSVFPESFLIYMPKDIVSGDFFWTSKHENYKIFSVIDCTGHGVPGAFMSMIGNNILNEAINQKDLRDPAKILEHLQQGIRIRLNQDEGKNEDGMDLGIGILEETDEGTTLYYAGAKTKLYLIQKGELMEISGDKKSIGGRQYSNDTSFTLHKIPVSKGDLIYLSTDGYSDQANPERERFTTKRLKNNILEMHTLPQLEQKELLTLQLKEFMADANQRDDITLMGIRISK